MSYSSVKLLDHNRPIIVFGCDGQIGKALQICLKNHSSPVVFLGRLDCDLSHEIAIIEVLERYQPKVIVNAAAYTDVDKAESERELAFAINFKAPAVMAHYIANTPYGAFVHYSTDYVFADSKQSAYFESDSVGPVEKLSVYGQSKLAGEQAIQEIFSRAHNLRRVSSHEFSRDELSRFFILRTSWVYGGGSNFIRTILHLALEREQLKVVSDQVGAPSSAEWLAEISIQIARSRVESGIYHAVPNGETSWHGLATFAIKTAASCCENIQFKPENILPIPVAEYPLRVSRPYNSRLSNTKLKNILFEMAFIREYPHWQEQVEAYVKDYVKTSFEI